LTLSQALEREKRYPRIARRRAISGSVTLQFAILPDGRVMDAKITHSSGHAVLNTATLQALKRASPMPPFPPSIKKHRLQVEVPIAYEVAP
jgi:protein TonB